jgi:hypothetical protein
MASAHSRRRLQDPLLYLPSRTARASVSQGCVLPAPSEQPTETLARAAHLVAFPARGHTRWTLRPVNNADSALNGSLAAGTLAARIVGYRDVVSSRSAVGARCNWLKVLHTTAVYVLITPKFVLTSLNLPSGKPRRWPGRTE